MNLSGGVGGRLAPSYLHKVDQINCPRPCFAPDWNSPSKTEPSAHSSFPCPSCISLTLVFFWRDGNINEIFCDAEVEQSSQGVINSGSFRLSLQDLFQSNMDQSCFLTIRFLVKWNPSSDSNGRLSIFMNQPNKKRQKYAEWPIVQCIWHRKDSSKLPGLLSCHSWTGPHTLLHLYLQCWNFQKIRISKPTGPTVTKWK